MHELLTCEEMAEADRRAVALGVPSLTLMENAGRAVADEAAKMVPAGAKIAVLCGPGNNGGDGFVAARYLKERGYDVRVACLVPVEQLKGDAAEMASGAHALSVGTATPGDVGDVDLVIDALFGAGLSRSLGGSAAEIIEAMNARGHSVLSVDVPSGLDGNTGASLGKCVVEADRTITFFRKKPGHLLMPGRALCGRTVVADIGIPENVLASPLEGEVSRSDGGGAAAVPIPPTGPSGHLPLKGGGKLSNIFENMPTLWLTQFPWPRLGSHKYTRGHALVVSGPAFQTGAARLSARGALRIGAGLVTVASPPSALLENAAHLTAIMLKPFGDARDLAEILEDKRKNAVLIGPGAGVGDDTRDVVLAALNSGAACVLDADALTSFATPPMNDEGAAVPFGFTGAAVSRVVSPELLFEAIKTPSPLGERVGVRGWTPSNTEMSAPSSPLRGTFSPRGEGRSAPPS